MIEKLLNKLLKLFYLGIFLVSMTYLGVRIYFELNQPPIAPSVNNHDTLKQIAHFIRGGVRGQAIDREGNLGALHPEGHIQFFAWDSPNTLQTTYTRRELCEALIEKQNTYFQMNRLGTCQLTVEACLQALETPNPYKQADLDTWTGMHRDLNRNQPNPDDAQWRTPREHWSGSWIQDVIWIGNEPRVGWNMLEQDGMLWGWDPKIPSLTKDEALMLVNNPSSAQRPPMGNDGQGGWKGVHVGYPQESDDGCDCILWITPKESYLECVNPDGLRTGIGLHAQYTWKIEVQEAGESVP